MVVCAACSTSAPGLGRTFDACEPLAVDASGATTAQQASLATAAAAWASVGVTAIAGAGATDGVRLVFANGSPAEYGFYDGDTAPPTITLNLDLDDTTRPIALAHELGHAFGLVHVAPSTRASVMNPGNLDVSPTAADAAAIAALWGNCAP
jgi:hypothetical protein